MTSRSRIFFITRRSIAVTALMSASAVLVLAGCHRQQDEASNTSSAKVLPDSAANSDAAAAAGASASAAAPAAASAANPATAEAQQIDVASLSAGAFAIGQSSDDWFRLVDGVPDSPGIQVNSNPYELVLALPGEAQITSFAFGSSPQRQVTPHHVKVDTAASASGPWTTAYDADIPGADNIQPGVVVRAPLQQPVTAKFLRLTLSSPPEQAPNGIGLSRFSAYGTPGAARSVRQVAGLYHFPLNFGSSGYVLLQQQGASVEGCYFESQGSDPVRVSQVLGTIVGGIEQGGYLRLTRNEQQSKLGTPGIMAFSPDGKQAFSALFTADAHTFSSVAESPGERVGASNLTCDPSGKPSDAVASQLEQTGHVQLYGVNFDLDKSTLRADAKPVLDRMATLLKTHADWKIEVAGHTDSTGEDAHNMKLSQDRADAVAQYLKSAGVTSTLTSKGYGSTQPLVPNTTDALRAQNRRVELVKQ
ncbi:OmpA family protein [Paraburkholderia susongensis]|uniref:OmpA family protein n=1 Tax=Paraburkholderia susongensis TaxID=1515439 RepID=A0A1X7LUB2_9BURK|nr:OmpA family protein [Paraburkholderia susongensis]SMG57067.1 OmpA family protein [Paraburkholderia susongensis]